MEKIDVIILFIMKEKFIVVHYQTKEFYMYDEMENLVGVEIQVGINVCAEKYSAL